MIAAMALVAGVSQYQHQSDLSRVIDSQKTGDPQISQGDAGRE